MGERGGVGGVVGVDLVVVDRAMCGSDEIEGRGERSGSRRLWWWTRGC